MHGNGIPHHLNGFNMEYSVQPNFCIQPAIPDGEVGVTIIKVQQLYCIPSVLANSEIRGGVRTSKHSCGFTDRIKENLSNKGGGPPPFPL